MVPYSALRWVGRTLCKAMAASAGTRSPDMGGWHPAGKATATPENSIIRGIANTITEIDPLT